MFLKKSIPPWCMADTRLQHVPNEFTQGIASILLFLSVECLMSDVQIQCQCLPRTSQKCVPQTVWDLLSIRLRTDSQAWAWDCTNIAKPGRPAHVFLFCTDTKQFGGIHHSSFITSSDLVLLRKRNLYYRSTTYTYSFVLQKFVLQKFYIYIMMFV